MSDLSLIEWGSDACLTMRDPVANVILLHCFTVHSPALHRLRTQAHPNSRQEQLQRAGHEPVCLVPGSVDEYPHVPDCILQKSLDTHSEGFLLC